MMEVPPFSRLDVGDGINPDYIPSIDIRAIQRAIGGIMQLPKYGSPGQRELQADTEELWARTRQTFGGAARQAVSEVAASATETLPASYAAIAAVAINVEREDPEDAEAVFSSIATASKELSEPTLVVPYLNYATADLRRDRAKVQDLRLRSGAFADRIREVALDADSNMAVRISEKMLPEVGTSSIGALRHNQALTALGLTSNPGAIFMLWDYDTIMSSNALVCARAALSEKRALFTTGTLHYVGEIMSRSGEEIAHSNDNDKLIYLVEHLRRAMYDHLPAQTVPEQNRGYLPEVGMGIRLDTLFSLGGFNHAARDNESWFLLKAATEALEARTDLRNYRLPHPRSGRELRKRNAAEPMLDMETSLALRSLVYYGEYVIETSNRGIVADVYANGPGALIGFDQQIDGRPYTLWTQKATQEGRYAGPGSVSLDEVSLLLSACYSYFKDAGGKLLAEDLISLNSLIHTAFVVDPAKGLSWLPQYLPKNVQLEARRTLVRPVAQMGKNN